MRKVFISGLSVLLLSTTVLAEDLKTILDRVVSLEKEGNYPKALDELGWARKEIEKKNSEMIGTLLPDSLAGFTGGKVETNGALGFNTVEREYAGENMKVKVSITSGGPGGNNQAMGGLAALGQMAAMFGQQAGQDVFRVDGMTASLNTEGSTPDLTVFLTGGSILKFELTKGTDTATLKKMAETIGVSKIDSKIKGVS